MLTLLTSSTFCSNSAKLFFTARSRRKPFVSGLASTWKRRFRIYLTGGDWVRGDDRRWQEMTGGDWVRGDLLQQHLQSRLDDLQVSAVLCHNILESCLQHYLLKVLKYKTSLCSIHSFFKNLLLPDIEHFFDVTASWWCHHWSWDVKVTMIWYSYGLLTTL